MPPMTLLGWFHTVMGVIAIGMLFYFRKRGWLLGGGDGKRPDKD